MKAAALLGLVLAIAFGMVAVKQVSSLQDISKPITTGAVNNLFGTTTFLTLLIVGVIITLVLVGAVGMFLHRS